MSTGLRSIAMMRAAGLARITSRTATSENRYQTEASPEKQAAWEERQKTLEH